ncbi:hypothetical protein TrCOL_g10415 [Triparma columacea]|uniref:GAF domain-containing protein n=1 Tax=Triparma columacea TaxID=722753 RepID=A0A9W7LD47_9STRA|nr:hypothetical protein TrCOL_g10415 [Triparma columacea]
MSGRLSGPRFYKMLESNHAVVIYTKANCSACARAKATLGADPHSSTVENGLKIFEPRVASHSGVHLKDVIIVDLDLSSSVDSAEFDRLASISGRRTVPVCFINGNYVGGGDDMVRMGRDGTLLFKLAEAKSIEIEEAYEFVNKHGSPAMPPAPPSLESSSTPPNTSESLPPPPLHPAPVPLDYNALHSEIDSLILTESDLYANAANVSSAVYHSILKHRGPDGCNWCGFYFARRVVDSDSVILLLGPFQGKPACRRIRLSEGVCGAAARTREVQRVEDVHSFPGHIACDSASNSELVIPMLHPTTGELLGVFDLDCPTFGGYTEEDASELGKVCEKLCGVSVFPKERIEMGDIRH